MFFFINLKKLIKILTASKGTLLVISGMSLLIVIVFSLLISHIENLRWFDAFYFSFITATTVGYGDITPHSVTAKILTMLYITCAMLALPTLFTLVGSSFYDYLQRKNKGKIRIHDQYDFLIIGGYELKLKKVIEKLLFIKPFLKICVLSDVFDTIPNWMKKYQVRFIRGDASSIVDLYRVKADKVNEIILLSTTPDDRDSDGTQLLSHQMIRIINQHAEILAEKVRRDFVGFPNHNNTLWIPVSDPGLIAKEALESFRATFDFLWEIFKTGVQKNIILDKDIAWKDLKLPYPLGYEEDGTWHWIPDRDTQLKQGTKIKYLSLLPTPLPEISTPTSLFIIGYVQNKTHDIIDEYRSDPRYSNANITILSNELEEPPYWLLEYKNVQFHKGVESDIEILRRLNISSFGHIVILAHGYNEKSDQKVYMTYCSVQSLAKSSTIFAELNREDRAILKLHSKDVLSDVTQSHYIVQELQNPGAMDFLEILNDTISHVNLFTQKINIIESWETLKIKLLKQNVYPVGYRLGRSPWVYLPEKDLTLDKPEILYIAMEIHKITL
jgi:hypothetical protein